jgi:hypothetical protein
MLVAVIGTTASITRFKNKTHRQQFHSESACNAQNPVVVAFFFVPFLNSEILVIALKTCRTSENKQTSPPAAESPLVNWFKHMIEHLKGFLRSKA